MIFPGLIYDSGDIPDSKIVDHEKWHVGEGILEEACDYCHSERCPSCKGLGMDNKCDLCLKCSGRGRMFFQEKNTSSKGNQNVADKT